MNKLTIKACPLCGGTHLERALTCVDHYASGEMFHLCRCRDCGFLFTQDFPVEAEIGRYYETPDYISHTDTRKGAMNSVYHWVRNYMLGRKARLVLREAHRKEGSLLDLGTGTGYFADAMQRRGWQVEAVEKSAQARAFAKEHFNLDVKPHTALKDFAPGSFDVITLWHVMEHLEPLNETWETLHSLLTEKGVLIVAVPNCSSFDGHHPAIRFQAWFHHGRAASHAVRCLLRLHADRKAHEALVYFPVGNGDRYTGLVQRVGEEGTQQFHDLRVQEERVRKGIRD